MGLLLTLRLCIGYFVTSAARPLFVHHPPCGVALPFFAFPCLKILPFFVPPSDKECLIKVPGPFPDALHQKQSGSRCGAFLYGGVLPGPANSIVHSVYGVSEHAALTWRESKVSGIDQLDSRCSDRESAFLRQSLNRGNVYGGKDGKHHKVLSLAKEKLELRSKIAERLVLNILDLNDISLIGQVLNEWLRNVSSRKGILSTLEDSSDRGDLINSAWSVTFVPYAQVARIVNAVMQGVGRSGHFEASLEILRWMERQGWCKLDPHLYTTIIDTLGNAGSFKLAENIFENLDSTQVKKDAALYNAMLNVRGKAGQIDLLDDLLESMKHTACQPDLVTYNTVMNSYVKAGMSLGTVVSIFREMYVQGIVPDLVSFHILLQACVSGGHVEEAHTIFRNLKKRDLKPNVVTYTTLITLYANSGRCMEALGLLSDMVADNCYPNTQTFSSVITACGRNGNVSEAERLFGAMEDLGVEVNAVTYNALIDMYGKYGDSEMAQKKFEELEQAGLKPTVFTISSIMSSFKTAGAYDKVLSFYERAKQDNICNEHVFAKAIDACIKWGKLQRIRGVQFDMVASNFSPNVVTCSIILVSLGSKCSNAKDVGLLVNFLQGFDSDLTVNCCRLLLEQFSSDEEVLKIVESLFFLLDNEDIKTWIVFSSALVDALWVLGWYRRAAHVVAWVMGEGLFNDICVVQPWEWKIDLRRLSSGTALVALYQWLGQLLSVAQNIELRDSTVISNAIVVRKDDICFPISENSERVVVPQQTQVEVLLPILSLLSHPQTWKDLRRAGKSDLGGKFPPLVTIVTGWGKLSKHEGSSVLKSLVHEEILKLRAPSNLPMILGDG